ncbi:hypothetical protein NDU88_001988 [Pleurodeles waltl]|uniref:Uncharacterized protein n=1 Tax=Pleurodeles waltl TaxID=8319 RepID=A0AAV7RCR8_PLEWA|nr:hypothetical protein NDU88_001988 [Pleurodeles waltl]
MRGVRRSALLEDLRCLGATPQGPTSSLGGLRGCPLSCQLQTSRTKSKRGPSEVPASVAHAAHWRRRGAVPTRTGRAQSGAGEAFDGPRRWQQGADPRSVRGGAGRQRLQQVCEENPFSVE